MLALTFRRESRSVIKAAAYEEMNALIGYLTIHGCQGSGGMRDLRQHGHCRDEARPPLSGCKNVVMRR